MIIGAILLALVRAADTAAPSPASSPLKTIIRTKTTPFCDVFRENVFHAVQGLKINDDVIDEGQSVLAKWTYDNVADRGKLHGASVRMDRYHLGQVAYQAAHNLTPVGRIHTGIIISQHITATVENQVANAVMPGVARCGSQ